MLLSAAGNASSVTAYDTMEQFNCIFLSHRGAPIMIAYHLSSKYSPIVIEDTTFDLVEGL